VGFFCVSPQDLHSPFPFPFPPAPCRTNPPYLAFPLLRPCQGFSSFPLFSSQARRFSNSTGRFFFCVLKSSFSLPTHRQLHSPLLRGRGCVIASFLRFEIVFDHYPPRVYIPHSRAADSAGVAVPYTTPPPGLLVPNRASPSFCFELVPTLRLAFALPCSPLFSTPLIVNPPHRPPVGLTPRPSAVASFSPFGSLFTHQNALVPPFLFFRPFPFLFGSTRRDHTFLWCHSGLFFPVFFFMMVPANLFEFAPTSPR